MICNNCNLGLGNFHDSTEVLIKAIQYLQSSPIIKKQSQPIPLPIVHSRSKQSQIRELLESGKVSTPKEGDYGFKSKAIVAYLDSAPIHHPLARIDYLNPINRKCRKCNETKDLCDFVKRSKSPLGRDTICKACHAAGVKISKANL